MPNTLYTKGIWKRITAISKKSRGPAFVAVAYFGQGGGKRLPLKSNSTLLVDASEGAVKSGQTDPRELLKLYKKRVKIYSYRGLHAKVFVFGTKTFVGSTNVSSNSAETLVEATILTTDRKIRVEAVDFIKSCCSIPLGEEALKRLVKMYRPPKAFGGRRRKGVPQRRGKAGEAGDRVYVVNGLEYCSSYRDKEGYKEGLSRAENRIKDYKVHTIDDFQSQIKPIRRGDLVLQVVSKGRKKYVLPLGRLVNTKKVKGSKSCFYYLEVPRNKRRRSLSRLGSSVKDLFARGGSKGPSASARIIKIFKE
jgi:hypothetical protein